MALPDGGPNVGDDNPSSSPKTRLKFLCTHGGEILPRPLDGLLKYVGGETRIVAVPRDVNFSDLMKKLNSLFDGDMVLKYQLLPEDFDLLVSVKSDEDVKHMLDEYDRHQTMRCMNEYQSLQFTSRLKDWPDCCGPANSA